MTAVQCWLDMAQLDLEIRTAKCTAGVATWGMSSKNHYNRAAVHEAPTLRPSRALACGSA